MQVLALAYKSGEAWNESAFSDAEFDAALEQALATPDPDARRAIMEKVEQILQDSGTLIQPYWRSVFRHHAPHVRNLTAHQGREFHFEDVWLDT